MSNMKLFGFMMAVGFTILGALCIAINFFKELKFPIPALMTLTGILFLMGATIIILLTIIIDHLQNQTTDDTE